MADAPAITGTKAGQYTVDERAIDPFSAVVIADPTPGATETVVVLTGAPGGTLTDGPGFSGLTPIPFDPMAHITIKRYELTGSPQEVTAETEALVYTPFAVPGTTSTLSLYATSSSGAPTAMDATTTVTDLSPPDAVSLSPGVSYAGDVFTLSGTASSSAGLRSVEISADVDGVATDLGAAAVNADGTFSFSDRVGDQQSFLVATLTDGAGIEAGSADPGFNLTGGLGPTGELGRLEAFGPTGQVSTALCRSNGTRFVNLEAPGQTVDLQPSDVVAGHHQGNTTFVYAPAGGGGAADVVGGFKLGGADRDTLDLPSSDFRDFAAVLRDTTYADGSATITDPETGDGIQLRGVTAAELRAHPKAFAFV